MGTQRRPIDWVMIVLAAAVVFSPAFAMAVADWADGLDLLWVIGLVGMVAGLMISISRFRSPTAHGLSFVYGLTWVGFLLASPLPYLLWRDKIFGLYGRVAAWIALALRGGIGNDELIFILWLGLLFWWLGYTVIWNTIRHQRIWRALLPPGIVLLVNVFYFPGTKLTPYLMIYLLCALLVVVRSYTVLQENRWTSDHIGYSSEVRFDLLRSGLVLASVVILLAWVAPTAASSQAAYELWQRVEGPWRRVEDDFNRLFSTLRSQAQVYGNPFGSTLALRGPRNLTDTPVMQVLAPPDKRFYWRGIVYDRYVGSGWINTDSDPLQLEAWREPKWVTFDAREEITQTFTLFLQADTLVFAAPQIRRVSLPVRAQAHISSDGTAESSQMISSRSLMQGASYIAVSALSTADVELLRGAGKTYPAWVRERYLQLPEGLPSFVKSQAQSIAQGLATPYDQAAAIEAWLRANIVYDDQTPAPPQDQDGVAYILTVKRGYCDYYASAMVVMLRSLGVPARVAVGYAQGRYDSVTGIYYVAEKDSHSWVEVYFPTYGWVEFEPTASQPVIDRPKPQVASVTPTPEADAADAGAATPRPPREREGPEDVDVFGGPYTAQRRLSAWLGVGIVGTAIAIAFLAASALGQRKRGRPGIAAMARSWLATYLAKRRARLASPNEASTADQPKGPDMSAGSLSESLRFWTGLAGLVEIAIALGLIAIWVLGRLGLRGLNPAIQTLGTWLGIGGVIQVLILIVLVATRIYERRGLGGLSPAAQVYARLLRFSNWLRVQWRDSQTPRERGAAFSAAAPQAESLIMRIADDYTREQYAPTPPTEGAEQVWQELSPALWLAGLQLRLEWFRRRAHEFRLWWNSFTQRMSQQLG
jgi:transglutaminase-like putative cysteine protease